MRSALLEVDGVTRVQIALQQGVAVVTYDAEKTTTDALLAAVNAANGPQGPTPYTASVKEPPRPASGS